jgi:predicted enzyme related to lactoylglutathione lyase
MTLQFGEVVIDCSDHGAVVDFWAAALGYERHAVNEQYVAITRGSADDAGAPAILFQLVPEPKSGKNRVHLDFRTDDMAAEVARLTALGATRIAERTLGESLRWTVMADPEGNEFCVAADGSA